jgi:hypothetical protein
VVETVRARATGKSRDQIEDLYKAEFLAKGSTYRGKRFST